MSVRFRSVNIFDSRVSTLLATECQKYRTRCVLAERKREPKTTSARPSLDWLQHLLEILWVILEIRILNRDHIASGMGKAAAHCGVFALIALVLYDGNGR